MNNNTIFYSDCWCVFRHELLPNELWVMKEYNMKINEALRSKRYSIDFLLSIAIFLFLFGVRDTSLLSYLT